MRLASRCSPLRSSHRRAAPQVTRWSLRIGGRDIPSIRFDSLFADRASAARAWKRLPGLEVGLTSVNARGTYLFVDVEIPAGTEPGPMSLKLTTAEGSTAIAFEISMPLPRSGRFQGFSQDDIIYLIMPDRFANGDPSNDDPAISRGLLDRSKARYYHGGDFQGIINRLPYLKSLGVTAVWLNPWYDNNNRLNRKEIYDGQPITDYHGYGAIDFYGVEEHSATWPSCGNSSSRRTDSDQGDPGPGREPLRARTILG